MSSLDQEPTDSAAIVCDVLRERVATQLTQVDGLDTKAAALLGFAGVLLGLLFANTDLTSHWNCWMTAAVVLLVLSAAALARSLWVRDWAVKPAAKDLPTSAWRPQHDTERILAAAFEAAWYRNNRRARLKALWIRGGTSLLAAAIVAAAVGLMIARSHVHPAPATGQASWRLLKDLSMPDEPTEEPQGQPHKLRQPILPVRGAAGCRRARSSRQSPTAPTGFRKARTSTVRSGGRPAAPDRAYEPRLSRPNRRVRDVASSAAGSESHRRSHTAGVTALPPTELSFRARRLRGPDDAQAEPREADVRRRAAAFVGIGLLVRHASDRAAAAPVVIASKRSPALGHP